MATFTVISAGRPLDDERTLAEQGWVRPNATTADGQSPAVKVMAIARLSPAAPAAAGEGGESGTIDPVELIRDAAERLTRDGFGDFELTDQATGRLVPIAPAARSALIAAIALHSKGREQLKRGGERGGADALPFFAAADAAYESCITNGAAELVKALANYGNLQLDICWAYTLMGDTEYLTDGERRLQIANVAVVQKFDQTLLGIFDGWERGWCDLQSEYSHHQQPVRAGMCDVAATQGRTLPGSVVPMVRFWLLSGVAKR